MKITDSQQEVRHLCDVASNDMIRNAIRKIALKGVVNQQTGAVNGTGRSTGYVVKIHDEEDDELFGTVDVQEYPSWAQDEAEDAPIGLHEGVLLTAIQNDNTGYVIIPQLYSEVVVSRDSVTGKEFVTMFSHVKAIQLDSHEKVSIGVRKREDFEPDSEDSPLVHELPLTGEMATTEYVYDEDQSAPVITTTVQGSDSNGLSKITVDPTGIMHSAGDDATVSIMDPDGFSVQHGSGEMMVDDSETTISQGSSKVKVENGTVYLGSDSGVDDAVLGKALAGILEEILDALAQVKTSTMMGPQPFINLPQFISIKAKISAFKGASSGFLTKAVQVQK